MYSSDRPYDDFRAPPLTYSERKLRSILRLKKIAFKDSQIIWYTGCDRYTPDLLVGKRLVVEVDGKVHDKDFQKSPDSCRKNNSSSYVVAPLNVLSWIICCGKRTNNTTT